MIRNSCKSFTILELIIVMLLFSILVEGTYYVLMSNESIIDKSLTQQYEINETLNLNFIFRKDFNRASSVSGNQYAISFTNKFSPPVHYIFDNKIIIRNNSTHTDTFNLEVINWEQKFAGKNAYEILELTTKQYKSPLVFMKKTDNSTSINNAIFNEN